VSLILFDDGTADGQTHAQAIRLRRAKRFENTLDIVHRKSGPGIGHLQTNLAHCEKCADSQSPLACFAWCHGLNRILDQIHQDLLDLQGVGSNPDRLRTQFGPELHVGAS
jgi:hypothetical protein